MNFLFKWTVVVFILVASFVAVGLRRATPRYNTPTSYRVKIEAKTGGQYRIDIQAPQTLSFLVSSNGEATLDIPRLPRACCWDLFGLTLVDGSPRTRRLVWVLRDNQMVRRLSIAELEQLPVNADGTIRLKLD